MHLVVVAGLRVLDPQRRPVHALLPEIARTSADRVTVVGLRSYSGRRAERWALSREG